MKPIVKHVGVKSQLGSDSQSDAPTTKINKKKYSLVPFAKENSKKAES